MRTVRWPNGFLSVRALGGSCVFLCGMMLASSIHAFTLPEEMERKYQSTLTLYREKQCQKAEELISELVKEFPQVERLQSDFIAISVGCKSYKSVLKYISNTYLTTAPAYVKEALLEASLKENDLQAAITVQRYDADVSTELMNRMVDNVYRALSDGDQPLADNLSLQLLKLYPNELKAWDTRGYVLREEGRYFEALGIYQQMLTRFPKNKNAPQAIANLLISLGMPQIAAKQVVTSHITQSAREKFRLQKEIAVRELRWSDTYDHEPKKRLDYAHRAINGLLAAREFAVANDLGEADIRSVDYDLVVAYEVGYQYQKSITMYESLSNDQEEAPSYVQLAVADSYSRARQYHKSESIYRKYLSTNPESIDATLGLYYSLIDQDQFDEAALIIDKLTESLREQLIYAKRRVYSPGEYRGFLETLSERYTSVKITQVNGLAYRDQLEEANQGIDNVLNEAPASDDALVAKGNIENWMGNPRSAEDYFKIVQNASPDKIEAQIGRADALFEQRDYASAKLMMAGLQQDYPERRSVQELARKMKVYDSPLVTGDIEFANGKASSQNLNSATADMRVYSDLIDDNYRVYARFRGLYSGPAVQSNVSAGTLGLRYDGPGHEISVEGGDRGYAKVEGTKYLDDSLSGSLSFERNAFYLFPGALYPIYSGNVFGGKVNWKNNDSQRALIGYQYWSLDNNNQTQMFGSFSQRLMTDYNYRLDGSLWIGNQQNTNPQVGYFAPLNQTEYSGTVSFEIMQWRDLSTKRYSFWHKFWGTYGVVTQQGFATLPMNTVGYGQNFTFGDKQRLVWGLGKTYFPFDGVRSSYVTGYLRFEKSF